MMGRGVRLSPSHGLHFPHAGSGRAQHQDRKAHADLDAKIGGTGEFRFYAGKGVTSVRLDELEPPVRVGWKTISANAPGGWEGTTITFDLRAEGGDTVLSFAHRGFAQADEGYALVTTGWAYYLVSLQQ